MKQMQGHAEQGSCHAVQGVRQLPRYVLLSVREELCQGVARALRTPALELCGAVNWRDLRALTRVREPMLVMLDARHPDSEKCLRVSREGDRHVPVLLLGEGLLPESVRRAADARLDDHFTRADLQRAVFRLLDRERRSAAPVRYHVGGLKLDFEAGRFTKFDVDLTLNSREQRLLRLLIQYRGVTLAHDVIIERVWEGAQVDRGTLAGTVKRLRDKLEDDSSNPTHILTVFRGGYTWRDRAPLAGEEGFRYNGGSMDRKGT